jgi:phosphoribosylformylglycinamidine synthase subunit PurQ / glutaminase
MKAIKALIFTGYGLNCDYETQYALARAGAEPHRMHINAVISDETVKLDRYDLLVFGGGFSWGDDHGAGVIMAAKMKRRLGRDIARFVRSGRLILGICNGFQCLVNLGLLPAFNGRYDERRVAITYNDSGNFVDTWVTLKANSESPCVFTRGIPSIELPVRHGEGKFLAADQDLTELFQQNQVVFQYADPEGNEADGRYPLNPNGSLRDIAGICDPTGRILGLMPHPEAYNHITNHPAWTRKKELSLREGKTLKSTEGAGIEIFRNAVEYLKQNI